MDIKEKWNERYRSSSTVANTTTSAAQVLVDNLHLLPTQGRALDLACGLGANAELLAHHGLEVHAWDIADNALQALELRMREQGLAVETLCRNVETEPPAADSFDVIVVSFFLHRPSIPALIAALKPGGLIYYQTFSRQRVSSRGPSNDEYRLARNELLQLFNGLDVLVYREEGLVGDRTQGLRDEALLVAQKPA